MKTLDNLKPYSLITVLTTVLGFASNGNAQSLITSDFSVNKEGWTLGNISSPGAATTDTLTYFATEGGFVRSVEAAAAGPWEAFAAPSAFQGNLSAYFHGTLTYDIRSDQNDGPSYSSAVLWDGNTSLHYVSAPPSTTAFTTYSVGLITGNWHINSGSGPLATDPQIAAVLANVQSFLISADWKTGVENADLGYVQLVAVVPEPSSFALFGLGLAGLAALRLRRRA